MHECFMWDICIQVPLYHRFKVRGTLQIISTFERKIIELFSKNRGTSLMFRIFVSSVHYVTSCLFVLTRHEREAARCVITICTDSVTR